MSQNWSEALLFIVVVAQFFCLTASVTSASRMMFAFSRDRAVPGHELWRKVGRNRVPHYAVIAICVLAAVIMLPAIEKYLVGYYVGTGRGWPVHGTSSRSALSLGDSSSTAPGASKALQVS
jgi:amino acid transporter